MPRCDNALCNHVVDKGITYHKIGDAHFCSTECATQWIETNERLTSAARRFFDQPSRQKPFLRERA